MRPASTTGDGVDISQHAIDTCIVELEAFSSRWKSKLLAVDCREKTDRSSLNKVASSSRASESKIAIEMSPMGGDVAVVLDESLQRRIRGNGHHNRKWKRRGRKRSEDVEGGFTGQGRGSKIHGQALQQVQQYLGNS